MNALKTPCIAQDDSRNAHHAIRYMTREGLYLGTRWQPEVAKRIIKLDILQSVKYRVLPQRTMSSSDRPKKGQENEHPMTATKCHQEIRPCSAQRIRLASGRQKTAKQQTAMCRVVDNFGGRGGSEKSRNHTVIHLTCLHGIRSPKLVEPDLLQLQ
jgi:hypothetical protein